MKILPQPTLKHEGGMVFTDAVIEMLERKAHGALVGRGKPYGTADFREEYSRQANKLLAALEKLMGSQ